MPFFGWYLDQVPSNQSSFGLISFAVLNCSSNKDHYRHLRRLDDLSKKAEDKGQLAAAINAEFRLGQSVGLYVDKKEIKVQDLYSF